MTLLACTRKLAFGVLLGLLAWPGFAAEPGVSDREILLGQSLGITGPLAQMAPDIMNGGKAYFDSLNAKGGIFGRKVRTLVVDDGYDAATTLKLTRHLVHDEKVFALYNYTGTANVQAVLDLLAAEDSPVPLIGPITGAAGVRQPFHDNVFHVRASYEDELDKLVQHLSTIGVRRIAVLWINNGMGKDGMQGMEKAMKKYALEGYASASIEPDGSDAARAVETLRQQQPAAIVMITTGSATVRFIKAFNSVQQGMKFYTLSVMGTSAALRALGPDGVGVVVTSVVPFPWSASNRLAREYQQAMKQDGFDNLSFLGFEAYINAKVLAEGLRRAGRELTRAKLVAALESAPFHDLGDFSFNYGHDTHLGSKFVELTMIRSGEKFAR